jgi:hypothetical protein
MCSFKYPEDFCPLVVYCEHSSHCRMSGEDPRKGVGIQIGILPAIDLFDDLGGSHGSFCFHISEVRRLAKMVPRLNSILHFHECYRLQKFTFTFKKVIQFTNYYLKVLLKFKNSLAFSFVL